MTISDETRKAMKLMADEIPILGLRMTRDDAERLVACIHDLLVSVLVDFENERREQGKKP